jgi:hypothetical protein
MGGISEEGVLRLENQMKAENCKILLQFTTAGGYFGVPRIMKIMDCSCNCDLVSASCDCAAG